MALAGRSSRSGGGRRLLIAALVVTILVVLLDASLKSRSPLPAETLNAQAWVDRALPVIASSTAEGQQVEGLRTSGAGMSAAQLTATLGTVASGASADYKEMVSLGSPAAAGGAPGLLEACLLARAKAAGGLAAAVTSALSSPTPPAAATDPAVTGLVTAGSQLQVADQAYELFAQSVPRGLGVSVPASSWLTDPGSYQAPAALVWLAALRSGTSLAPVHQVVVDSVSTNPPPVSITGGVQDIPPTRAISVTVVVADTGNQAEGDLTVTASVAPAAPGTATSVRDFVSLRPGTSAAVSLGPLSPPSGVASTLTVTVTAPAGSPTAPATTTLPIEVAAPPPPSTTTTVPVSTTVGGKGDISPTSSSTTFAPAGP